jgi:hypothetical protein
MFFDLDTGLLALVLFALILGAAALGAFLGRRFRHLSSSLSEPFGVLQGALLGVVGLILAFGLSLALSRYEDRRAAVVTESNAIGTTYLRAQTLPEPVRSRSLNLLAAYLESAIGVADNVPGSPEENEAAAEEERVQRLLWALAGTALEAEPVSSATRLYVESLNEMIDSHTVQIAALDNQVPGSVFLLEIVGAALALGLLATYLALVGRGVAPVLLASVLVAFLLFVTADLDRPTRGLIQVPDTALESELESTRLPPAALPPAPAETG